MRETRFKNTEIGMIPADWEVFNVGKDCSIKARIGWQGLTTAEYLDHGEYGLITSTDIVDGKVNWKSCVFVSKDRYEQDTNIVVKDKDVLISKDGTIGKIAVVSDMPFPATLNSGVFVVRTQNDKVSQIGLGLAFSSSYFKDFIKRLTAGSTIVHLYQKDIVNFCFPLPPVQEQERIAKVLSDVDALIVSYDKLIAKKQAIKQGAMQLLLTGKKRLKGFNEPWVEKRLGDCAKIYRGGSPRPIEDFLTTNKDGVNWIKIGDVSPTSKYINSTEEKIKPSGICRSRQVCKGDFIISNSMSYGRPYILNIDGCIHDGWLVVQDYKETFDLDFLYYFLSSDRVMKQYETMAAGSSVKNLSKEKVADVCILYPRSLSEQRAIATILTDMDNDIVALQRKKVKYEALKQGMMQQLLTGRIRLSVNEEDSVEQPITDTGNEQLTPTTTIIQSKSSYSGWEDNAPAEAAENHGKRTVNEEEQG